MTQLIFFTREKNPAFELLFFNRIISPKQLEEDAIFVF